MFIQGNAFDKSDLEPIKLSCYKAIAAGTGYAIGDELIKVYNYDSKTGTIDPITPFIWINTTTDTVLAAAPTLADLEKCDKSVDAELNKKVHTDTATGEFIEIYEVVLTDKDGVVVTPSTYILADGTATAFVPTGIVRDTAVRVTISDAVVAFDDTAAVSLTVPAFAAGAHIQVHQGVDAKMSVTSTPVTGLTGIGDVVLQGQTVILHSAEELADFGVIGVDGTAAGEIYVQFFNTSIDASGL